MGRERPELRMPRVVEQPIVPKFVRVLVGIALVPIVLYFLWMFAWATLG